MTTPTSSGSEVVRRLTITERPGYEPDGYGFARRVEDKLFGMALAINKREQERKAVSGVQSMTSDEKRAHQWSCDLSRGDVQCSYVTPHGDDGFLNCTWKAGHPCTLDHSDCYNDGPNASSARWALRASGDMQFTESGCPVPNGFGSSIPGSWASPETLTAQLRRLRFEIQTTQTRLAEADKLIEKVLAGL